MRFLSTRPISIAASPGTLPEPLYLLFYRSPYTFVPKPGACSLNYLPLSVIQFYKLAKGEANRHAAWNQLCCYGDKSCHVIACASLVSIGMRESLLF